MQSLSASSIAYLPVFESYLIIFRSVLDKKVLVVDYGCNIPDLPSHLPFPPISFIVHRSFSPIVSGVIYMVSKLCIPEKETMEIEHNTTSSGIDREK